MKVLEHAMNIIERKLKRKCELVDFDCKQFRFMPGRKANICIAKTTRRILRKNRNEESF